MRTEVRRMLHTTLTEPARMDMSQIFKARRVRSSWTRFCRCSSLKCMRVRTTATAKETTAVRKPMANRVPKKPPCTFDRTWSHWLMMQDRDRLKSEKLVQEGSVHQ